MAAQDLIIQLQQTQEALQKAAEAVQKALGDGALSLKDQVELGQSLWCITNSAQGALEPIKDSLRAEATQRQKGKPGRQFLAGRARTSRCTVVIPPPEFKLRPGVDAEALRRVLGKDFEAFFRVTVTPRKEFADRAAERPDLLPDLTRVVDMVSDKPRVSFND